MFIKIYDVSEKFPKSESFRTEIKVFMTELEFYYRHFHQSTIFFVSFPEDGFTFV
jgi:hypothetical protein